MILKVPTPTARPSVIHHGIDRMANGRIQAEALETEPADWLELSDAAQTSAPKPAIREDLVQKLRESIASGQYLTTDRLEGAVEGLRDELFGKR